MRQAFFYDNTAFISPQAIFSPEAPEGCVRKSSKLLWITIVLPTTSFGVNLSVRNERDAFLPAANKGGISPA